MIMETTPLEKTGTKPTENITLTFDHDPYEYFIITDKNFGQDYFKDRLVKGSVWRMDGKEYSFDERVNYYGFKRIDQCHSTK